MKKIFSFTVLIIISLLFISNTYLRRSRDPILAKLGISDTDALWKQFNCASNDNCVFSAPKMQHLTVIKALATGDKLKVAGEALAYTKEYYKSKEFHAKYQEQRMANKPRVAEISPETRDLLTQQLAEYKEAYTPEILDMLPEEARATALFELKRTEATLAGDMDPEERKKWELRYPADPNVLLRKNINNFLEQTKNVDYSAPTKLNPKNNHQVFTNPAYEKKDNQWKACYRAGRELTDATRAFAKEWLAELK
jgi:hypothetical protein